MGNQSTSPRRNQSLIENFQSKHNKHFNYAYFNNLKQSQIKQLIKDLNLDEQKYKSLENQCSSNKQLIHCLQFNDDFSFEKVFSRLSSRVGLSHKHLFNVKNIKVNEQKSLCSISRKLFVSQQSYDFTLNDLIKRKSQEKQSFSEEQIFTILNKIVQAVIWMNDNEFRNVILDSEAITFVSEFQTKQESLQNYVCKIIDQDIVQTSCYKKLVQNFIERRSIQSSDHLTQKINLNFYLSPQLLQEIQNHNFYPTVSLKSDIFTLGMLIMELCCQEEMYFCYNMETITLDYESLIHRIAKISYSNELKLLIAEMLEYDENNRIGFVSLKEKIDKIMVKPFDETRKLKRRSSSTMLKQLLSCSRASYSLENCSRPTLKNNSSSKISTVSLSAQKKQIQPSPKNQNQTQQRTNNSLTKCNSLTKSNSLVNLKCKTNSFLTSKKSTLLRVNSSKKLETQSKNVMQKQIKLQTNKIDYSKILKNRMKTQPRNLERPLGDQSMKSPTAENMFTQFNVNQNQNRFNQEKDETNKTSQISRKKNNQIQKALRPFDALMTDRSIHEDEMDRVSYRRINHSNFQQLNIQKQIIDKKIQDNNFRGQQSNRYNHSFVQKKVINLENVKVSSSQKVLKSKSLLTNPNQMKSTESPIKKERFSTEGNQQEKIIKANQKIISEEKSKPKQNSISLKKIYENRSKRPIIQKPEQKTSDEIKNTNKSWIMGKLKAKNFIETNNKQKNKSTGKKKESSLTKIKSVSFAPQISKNEQFAINQNYNKKQNNSIVVNIDLVHSRADFKENEQNFRRGDTIIKRLQMTDQKIENNQVQFQQQDKEIIRSNVKNQIRFVEKVLQKCALSSSRWQDETQTNKDLSQSNFRHQNFMKYSEYKQKLNIPQKSENLSQKEGQFKKKSKVIDIDLGRLNSKSEQNIKKLPFQDQKLYQKQTIKNQKQTTSKLKKLKQLTIFTQDQQQKQIKDYTKQHINYLKNDQNANKENNMRNSNLQDLIPEIKLNNIDQKMRKSNISHINPNLSSSLLGFNQIPYQRIQYVNKVSTVINPAITTPSSLNELNKFYGKGMTVQSSIQQSAMYKKNNSTLSKPFQQIQLYYENQRESQPQINSPNLKKDSEQIQPESRFKKSIAIGSIKRQNDIFSMNNSQELTFRLKTSKMPYQQINSRHKQISSKNNYKPNQLLNIQKVSYFEKQDGSFVMREQNPLKKIQTSSIIRQKSIKNNQGTGHFQEFFTSSNSKFNNKQVQSQYQGYKQSFLDLSQHDKIMRQEDMNSSCSSINLSEIEYKAQKGESLLFTGQQKDIQKKESNSKQRKYKHISILEPQDDTKNKVHELSINIKNINNQKNTKNIIVQQNHESQQNTYRRYLKSDDCNSYIIELDNDFVYEGEINEDGQFEGSGMIYRKDNNKGKNSIIFTGSFVNGLYQGFGTLYQIKNQQSKRLRIPNYGNRITFGSNRNQSTMRPVNENPQTQIPIKYEGQFSQGMQNGFGTYFYSNGDKFSGCIKQGMVQGYGTYHIALTNEVISGMWKNNVFKN